MRNVAQQSELDAFEASILTTLFGKPEIPPAVDLILTIKKIKVQKIIDTFEDIMEPFLLENGLVDLEAFKKLVAFKYPKMLPFLPKENFRLIEIMCSVEPLLSDIRKLIM